MKKPNAKLAKIRTVMDEFKSGELHSGSAKGKKVTNPKQAIAIALNQSKGYAYGGAVSDGATASTPPGSMNLSGNMSQMPITNSNNSQQISNSDVGVAGRLTPADNPIYSPNMNNRPAMTQNYAKGGLVRGGGIAARGVGKGTMR